LNKRRPVLLCVGLAATVAWWLSVAPLSHAQAPPGGVIVVQIVPKLPKITLSLDGRRFKTDRNGRARVVGVSSQAELERELRVIPTRIRRGVRARFGGWYRGRLGLAIDYFVRPRFVDVAGNRIDPSRIESITLKNSYGLPERFDGARLGWLQGRGLLSTGQNLEMDSVNHSVHRVVVDGSNVVNRGQQRFGVARNPRPRIELLFFSARFRGRDALFGFPSGSTLRLEFPNGRRVKHELGSGSELTLSSLPRGLYEVDVEGPGVSFSRPLDLSRNQDLKLQVITWVDFVAALLLLAAIVLALLLIGRPALARQLPWIGPRLSRRFGLDSRSS
jgi:hypothetical protein